MKKFFKFIFTISFVFFIGVVCFCCNGQADKDISNLTNVLSEYRKNLFVGQSQDVVATFTSGKRESEYIMNGKSTTLVSFGVLTLKSKNKFINPPKFSLKINEDFIEGVCEKNPFDSSYVFDIEREVEDGDSLILYLKESEENIILDCWSKNWKINYLKSLNIFAEKQKDKISSYFSANKLSGEVYIKIVTDDESLTNTYWYVLLVCENGDIYASLIDTQTGEIVQN